MVGVLEVLQQTPLAVTSAPPLLVMLPPEVPDVSAIFVIALVVKTGNSGSFLQLSIIAIPNNRQTKTKNLDGFLMLFIFILNLKDKNFLILYIIRS
jgi:hypothetical protein